MKKVKEQLKRQAADLLPDDGLKDKIASLLPAPERREKKRARSFKPVFVTAVACLLVAVVAVTVLWTGGFFGGGSTVYAQESVIIIDINPSFEIVTDEKGNVKYVTGLNSDARIVILGKNYAGKNYVDVCKSIVSTSVSLNYVTDTNNTVTVTAYNEDRQVESSLVATLNDAISSLLQGTTAHVDVSDSEHAKQKLMQEIKEKYGITQGLDNKTLKELHRILMAYDITKESQLDKLEDEWEKLLEEAGYDDDTAEEILDKWKEENLVGKYDDDEDDEDEDEDDDDDEDKGHGGNHGKPDRDD